MKDGGWSFYWPDRNFFPQRKHSYIVMIDYLYESLEFGGACVGAEKHAVIISNRIPHPERVLGGGTSKK